MVAIYNNLIGVSYKKFAAKFNVCSNTFPNTVSETKSITLTKVVQVSSPPLISSTVTHRSYRAYRSQDQPNKTLDRKIQCSPGEDANLSWNS